MAKDFNYVDVCNAVNTANTLLEEKGSLDRFKIEQHFKLITITVQNIQTQEENLVFEHIYRTEAYYWLAGFNSGLMNK